MKSTTKQNLIFLLVVLAVIGGLLIWRHTALHTGGAGTEAVLQYGDPTQEMRIPLDKDAVYDVDTGFYTIHLQVKDGGIAFIDSPCPDHLCEGFGTLRKVGDWAACMPARASLSIVD
nr:NusG domain II-containing protein [uncultured Gemmiger sp.]